MRVVLYERRSTDNELQHDSHESQDEELRRDARSHDDQIVRVYRDDATGTNAQRRDFQRLIRDVQHADFDGILVLDVTRWGRFGNVDESAYWEFFCLLHGVIVRYVNEPFRNDGSPYDAILKTIKRVGAAEYSKDKSRTVQYAKARVVRNGFYPGGSAPYGMKRLMVRPDGTVVQELKAGEHKAIGNYRIKLAPGNPDEVAVVQRIYALFLSGMNRKAIARTLDAEHVRPPLRGTDHWYYGEVHKILRNPVYAGFAKVRCKPSVNFKDGETILSPNAWSAVISVSDWELVQRRLDESLFRRTPLGLAQQLKDAFERYGPLDKKTQQALSLPLWETYLKHFTDGTQEALCIAYNAVIERERTLILRALRKEFRIDDDGEVATLDGLLRLRITASFPRMLRRGVYWEFRFHEDDGHDVTIGIGFSPPPVHRLQLFLFHNGQFHPRKRIIHPNLDGKTINNHYRRTMPAIIKSLRYEFFRDARQAKERFLNAVKDQALITTAEIATRCGWPHQTTYSIYASLRREGKLLPPLKHGRKATVTRTCPSCGRRRVMPLYEALAHKTELCAQCWHAQRGKNGRTIVTCPQCGRERAYWTSTLKKLKHGERSFCFACMPKFRATAHATRQRNDARRRANLHHIASVLADRLRDRYDDVRLHEKPRRLAPWVSWREPAKHKRQFLRVRCSQQTALRLTATEQDRLGVLLANRRRWRRAHYERLDLFNVRVTGG